MANIILHVYISNLSKVKPLGKLKRAICILLAVQQFDYVPLQTRYQSNKKACKICFYLTCTEASSNNRSNRNVKVIWRRIYFSSFINHVEYTNSYCLSTRKICKESMANSLTIANQCKKRFFDKKLRVEDD